MYGFERRLGNDEITNNNLAQSNDKHTIFVPLSSSVQYIAANYKTNRYKDIQKPVILVQVDLLFSLVRSGKHF